MRIAMAKLKINLPPAPADTFEDRKLIPVPEWRERNGVSKSQWHRHRDEMPPTIRISARREAISVGDERRWQEARRRGA
jgi:hypothetical protein